MSNTKDDEVCANCGKPIALATYQIFSARPFKKWKHIGFKGVKNTCKNPSFKSL